MQSYHSRPYVGDVRHHVTCNLCHGYLIDATTVVRCLHTFCRACLLRRLSDTKQCPQCASTLDENRISKEIRRDHILQKLVYKSVPGLLTSELKRRRDFVANHRARSAPCDDVTMSSQQSLLPADMTEMKSLCADDDDVSVCLQMVGSSGLKSASEQLEQVRRRYLLCPVSTSVSLLKKFVFLKLDLSDHQYAVEVFHDGESMEEFYTLMDITYMSEWDRSGPLTLDYLIVSRNSVVSPVRAAQTDSQATLSTSAKEQPADRCQSATATPADVESTPMTPLVASCSAQSAGDDVSARRCDDIVEAASRPLTAASTDDQALTRLQTLTSSSSDEKSTERRCTEKSSPARRQLLTGPCSVKTGRDDDDSCLSISTSVTVVISRRPPPASTTSDSVTADSETETTTNSVLTSDSCNQVVVNATIPAAAAAGSVTQSLAISNADAAQRAPLDTISVPSQSRHSAGEQGADAGTTQTQSTASLPDQRPPSCHVTTDITQVTSGCGRPKRKSLESVIQSLQPAPIATSRPQEVVRSRPEVLVRPMQLSTAAKSNQLPVSSVTSSHQVGRCGLSVAVPTWPCSRYRSPQAVDLRRPKRPNASGTSQLVLGTSRRKPRSLSPLQAPPGVDHPTHSLDKRPRFNSTSAEVTWPRTVAASRFPGHYLPPSAALAVSGLTGSAVAAAARYHACLAAARLPVYYHGRGLSSGEPRGQQRPEPNGYDAPLELTTRQSRDRI